MFYRTPESFSLLDILVFVLLVDYFLEFTKDNDIPHVTILLLSLEVEATTAIIYSLSVF